MIKKNKKLLSILLIFISSAALVFVAIALIAPYVTPEKSEPTATNTESKDTQNSPTQPEEAYKGESIPITDTFSIKIPNGWIATIPNSDPFFAVVFARQNQLQSLAYNSTTPPVIDTSNVSPWNGLTEHFFIAAPAPNRQFNQNDHLEVTSEPFVFDDGYIGQKYYVVKHAAEAQKWGGLQKDTEWQGRTYIYEKDGKRIEAHLALYPSSGIDVDFYEKVIRSLHSTAN